jgi:hypothetical protein
MVVDDGDTDGHRKKFGVGIVDEKKLPDAHAGNVLCPVSGRRGAAIGLRDCLPASGDEIGDTGT